MIAFDSWSLLKNRKIGYYPEDISFMVNQKIRFLAVILGAVLLTIVEGCAVRQDSLRNLPSRAVARSEITSSGSPSFHLQARVFEVTNPDNHKYDAEIDEVWAAPNKWRRTIKSANFSQVLITRGSSVSDQITGDYYPHWLQTLINAMFKPGVPLQGVDLTKSDDNPEPAGPATCRRFGYHVGISPVQNTVFATYCFQNGLIQSVGRPDYGDYGGDYSDYKRFSRKQVARKIQEWIEPGTTVEADIVGLDEVQSVDDSILAIEHPTQSLRTVFVNEQALRGAAIDSPPIQWPTIHDGKPVGTLSIYVCVDRQGHVRETYGLNSDNPYMTDAARKQLMHWNFKPLSDKGESVQAESILTFAYQTRIVTN